MDVKAVAWSATGNTALPVEINLQILQCVDKPTLKSLRQCSKSLELATTPLLFGEIVVLPYRSSFAGLIDLASNTGICRAVKKIRYETHAAFPETFPPTEETDDIHIWFEDLAYLEHNHPGLREYLEWLRKAWLCPDLEGYYYQCLGLGLKNVTKVSCQCEMHLLAQVIENYPSVKVLTLTSKPFWHKEQGQRCSVARPIPQYFQKWFSTHKATPETPMPTLLSCCFSNGGASIVSYRAKSLLLALCMHKQRIFHVEMEGILVRLFTQIPVDECISEMWRNNGLRNIEQLQIQFQKEPRYNVTYPENYGNLAELLTQNEILTRLRLEFHNPTGEPQCLIHEIAGKNFVPPLRGLELSNLVLPGRLLLAFLKLVTPTLHTLKLNTIHLCGTDDTPILHDNWTNIIKWLAEDMSLSKIQFSGTLKGHNHEIITSIWDQAEKDIHSNRIKKSVPAYLEDTYDISAFSMDTCYHPFLGLATDMSTKSGKQICLVSKIHDYIKGKETYPQQLRDFNTEISRANTEVMNRPKLVGDYSWAMLTTGYVLTLHERRSTISHLC